MPGKTRPDAPGRDAPPREAAGEEESGSSPRLAGGASGIGPAGAAAASSSTAGTRRARARNRAAPVEGAEDVVSRTSTEPGCTAHPGSVRADERERVSEPGSRGPVARSTPSWLLPERSTRRIRQQRRGSDVSQRIAARNHRDHLVHHLALGRQEAAPAAAPTGVQIGTDRGHAAGRILVIAERPG
jgi:hypothetical protein